jgi:hypothetical protein
MPVSIPVARFWETCDALLVTVRGGCFHSPTPTYAVVLPLIDGYKKG